MKYKIVQNIHDHFIVTNLEESNLHAALEVRGFEFTGVNTNKRSRQELWGEPVFSGLLGPMWDGTDEKGEGIVRYEDQQTYNRMSA